MTRAAVRPLEGLPTVQSSVGLFEQLHGQGYGDADLARVRAAYGAAMALFSGCMHPCGKPYIAHCTGAAGALAALAADTDVVIAGLLHGAYRSGDFGSLRVFHRWKRGHLRARCGAVVEEYIHRFFTLPWNPDAVRALSTDAARLDGLTRTAVLMRLASELDNFRDHAQLYCRDADLRRDRLRGKRAALIALASQLGFPTLAAALAVAIEETLQGHVPADLQWLPPNDAFLPPESSTRKFLAVVSGMLATQLRRARP
jgi:hypothetical protein